MTTSLTKYTVLLLLPDTYWEGHQSDWIKRVYVEALRPDEAIGPAIKAAIADWDALEIYTLDDFAVLAIYEGHLFDLFVA